MNVQEARERIKKLQDYIELVEGYEPTTFEEDAIKQYALLENVTQVANELNEKGYRVGNRKVIGKDVSDIIRSKPRNKLHEMAQLMFRNNRGRAQKRGWM